MHTRYFARNLQVNRICLNQFRIKVNMRYNYLIYRVNDVKTGTLVGVDKYGNKYYEDNKHYFFGESHFHLICRICLICLSCDRTINYIGHFLG